MSLSMIYKVMLMDFEVHATVRELTLIYNDSITMASLYTHLEVVKR